MSTPRASRKQGDSSIMSSPSPVPNPQVGRAKPPQRGRDAYGSSSPAVVCFGQGVSVSDDQKRQLHDYLTKTREAVIWKAEGLPEYEVRRPLTRTGTNLLGLVKHLSIDAGPALRGDLQPPVRTASAVLGRRCARRCRSVWVAASEDRREILGTYEAATAHADETIRSLDLDALGHVPWWRRPNVTLHAVLVHVVTETARHAGHADSLRAPQCVRTA